MKNKVSEISAYLTLNDCVIKEKDQRLSLKNKHFMLVLNSDSTLSEVRKKGNARMFIDFNLNDCVVKKFKINGQVTLRNKHVTIILNRNTLAKIRKAKRE